MKTRSPSLKGIAYVTIEPSIFPSDNSSFTRATSIGLVGALCAAASAASASSAVSTVPLQQYDERTVVDSSHKAYLQEKESTSKILVSFIQLLCDFTNTNIITKIWCVRRHYPTHYQKIE